MGSRTGLRWPGRNLCRLFSVPGYWHAPKRRGRSPEVPSPDVPEALTASERNPSIDPPLP
jgi:hypothetical protein